MTTITRIAGGLAMGLMVLWSSGCGRNVVPDGGNDGGPFDHYVPDPNVYAGAVDPAMIIEQTTGTGATIRFAVNQLVLLMNEGTTRSTVEALAHRLGGTIVGQVPDIDFYQIELSTTTRAQLDAAVAQAEEDPNVTAAGYNVASRLNQSCPAANDNAEIFNIDKCAFTETEYYNALTMFDFFRPHLALNPVTVAVIDSGLDPTTGEFDNTDVFYLNNLRGPPVDSDPDRHGTMVCGMIAADDDMQGINGIASRFLLDNLSLAVAGWEGIQLGTSATGSCVAHEMLYTFVAAAAGAQVINLSIGYEPSDPHFRVIRETWKRRIARLPGVVFVAAAGNETTELDGNNSAPGGIGLPNLITVAGTARCEPDRPASFTNYGPVVDVAAPAEDVPVVFDGVYVTGSGTSFATPMVASLAAILKSIQPTLTPAQVKHYIVDCAHPLYGNPFGRLMFTNSICQLLIDMGVGDPIRSWIDPMGLGSFGASGLVLSRICPAGIVYTVDGYGTYQTYYETESDHRPAIAGSFGGTSFTCGGGDGDASIGFTSLSLTQFVLGTYIITTPEEAGPDTAAASFTDFTTGESGMGMAGSITFDACQIDQRSPFDGINPWIVRLSGAFAGVLQMAHNDRAPTFHEFEGSFSVPLLVLAGAEDSFIDYLENTCEGGIPRPHE
ncbi:MAG TPA: S8 family serine peptidase [Phycisphaerae bacterium]|nr:S8 family serine peptidase [Phycisphaerae bacterium]